MAEEKPSVETEAPETEEVKHEKSADIPKEEKEPEVTEEEEQENPEQIDEFVVLEEVSENPEEEQNGDVSAKDGEVKENGKAGLGTEVAKHYNQLPEGTKEGRKESKIMYLRNFNNWVKSVVINEYLEKVRRRKRHYDPINILDLGCGKGGDLLKWQKGRVTHLICSDIAETSLDQCKERYNNLRRQHHDRRHNRDQLFSIEYVPADCTKVRISQKYKKTTIRLDMTSCQFVYHYSFESYEQADLMLKNACENLRYGGYFLGTTPDACQLVKRVRDAEENSFGNSIYNIEFENKESFPAFGCKYNFKLDDVVDCPEFLVYFPILEKMALKYNMRLVYKKNFHEFLEEKIKRDGNRYLLQRMEALETYPAKENSSLISTVDDAYNQAKEFLESSKAESLKDKIVGTLSKDEWEAAGLYLVFVFEKFDPEEERRKEERRKREEERKKEEEKKREEKRKRDEERRKEEEKRKEEERKKDEERKERKRKLEESKEEETKEAKLDSDETGDKTDAGEGKDQVEEVTDQSKEVSEDKIGEDWEMVDAPPEEEVKAASQEGEMEQQESAADACDEGDNSAEKEQEEVKEVADEEMAEPAE